MKLVILTFLLLSSALISVAQDHVWLHLKEEVSYNDVSVDFASGNHFYSKWLHVIGVELTKDKINSWLTSGMVSKITTQRRFVVNGSSGNSSELGFALDQIEAELLMDRGLSGAGVSIGVIDGGFLNADEIEPLEHLFDNQQVKEYRDYITPELEPYAGIKALDDRHGSDVLQLIAGRSNETGVIHGLATASDYYLARTDHGASEKKVEEMYLVQALEWMDSLDVKLVNISLGYTEGFDDSRQNYQLEDINGASVISRAVQHASDKEGMLIVISAGNDGDKNWGVLSIPADARGALTVGASKLRHWDKMAFSSTGPDLLPYLKPEISCFASDGTSFSTPIITGLAALIWQAQPNLTNYQVKDIIMKSGHLYPYGNNYVGYGVPLSSKVLLQLDEDDIQTSGPIKVYKNTYRLSNKVERQYVVYHKSDKRTVLKEDYTRLKDGRPKIKRPENASFTTIILDNSKVYELQWMRE